MNEKKNQRVMAIAAHPDDIEFVMAGTLILLGRAGYELHYMNIANGCCGSTRWSATRTAEIRLKEAIEAADLIGAEFHPPLTADLQIFYDSPTLARLAAIVREVSPEIVLTHAPIDYMEDHTNACRLAVTAAFARGMPNFPTEPARPPVDGPVTIYHAQPHGNRDPLGHEVRPGVCVDVSGVIDEKAAMLACHKSQQDWLDTSQGMGSYIEAMKSLNREVGQMSGRCQYAEGWRKHLHLGFCDESADPLRVALGAAAVQHELCLSALLCQFYDPRCETGCHQRQCPLDQLDPRGTCFVCYWLHVCSRQRSSDGANRSGARTFGSLAGFVLDSLAFAQFFDRHALQRRVMEKQIVAIRLNESKTLFGQQLLDLPLWHFCSPT